MIRMESIHPDTVTSSLLFLAVSALQECERRRSGQDEGFLDTSNASDMMENERRIVLFIGANMDRASILPVPSPNRRRIGSALRIGGSPVSEEQSVSCGRMAIKENELREVVVHSIGDSLGLLKSTKLWVSACISEHLETTAIIPSSRRCEMESEFPSMYKRGLWKQDCRVCACGILGRLGNGRRRKCCAICSFRY